MTNTSNNDDDSNDNSIIVLLQALGLGGPEVSAVREHLRWLRARDGASRELRSASEARPRENMAGANMALA